ncbi:MAG: hypothetical protein KBG20_07650 [Caldilineaceae bacterium]|nr:hypothetical protein [Caldilineaceae bacterium]MBP8106936.1 hypothetical protein [Caldilineaceae bacterium]MBP8121856.1 hypothetical protein [Caldilineaceae bacterium]MBP9072156.1 hypothetical protein [Caldilineaceae bacterium]
MSAQPLRAQEQSLSGHSPSQPQELVPLDGIAYVAAGGSHTCALTTTGGVKCWGDNYNGQLGDGTTREDKDTPVDVVRLGSGVAAIAAGREHTCAVSTAGGVKCWGRNNRGQLGDGTNVDKSSPVDVMGLGSGVVALAAGGNLDNSHTCALTTAGKVKCWGANQEGQLGDGTTTSKPTPVDVEGLGSDVTAIAAGSSHTCALTTSGGVKCWGGAGAVGDGTWSGRLTPVDVVGLGSGVTTIAAGGAHSCALTTAGGVKCWGSNFYGEVGDGTLDRRLTPVDVVGLGSGVTAIAAGGGHTCALTTAGGVKCWGANSGQVGDGTTENKKTPVDVMGLDGGIVTIAAGYAHTCAATNAGGVKCWGQDEQGQVGNGTSGPIRSILPVDVAGLSSGVGAIAAGSDHTCALGTGGSGKCWGLNSSGQLGDGTTVDNPTPVDVVGLGNGVAAIDAGGGDTCVLTTTGGVKCWGDNRSGQLGDGTLVDKITPVDVTGLTNGADAIASGGSHTCALTTEGGVKCWGANGRGQLGDGTTVSKPTPVDVVGLSSGVAAIAAGSHTCALTTAGGVKCWGANSNGELGDGTTESKTTPVDVVGLGSGVTAIAVGSSYTCALITAGGVKCWGANGRGQLGDGTTTSTTTPVDVAGLGSGVTAIAASILHTCALTTAGGVKCWGYNTYGQLGDGTIVDNSTPVDVMGLDGGMAAIAVGVFHTCALTTAGGVKCWGYNNYGQMGDGTTWRKITPVDVMIKSTTLFELYLPMAIK